MRLEDVFLLEKKKNTRGFLGVEEDTITFTQYAGEYDDGSSRSPYKKTFAEKLFNKGAQKVVESVKTEKELLRVEKSKLTDVTVTSVPPTKVGGYLTYSTMIGFNYENTAYMLSYNSEGEANIKDFEHIFKEQFEFKINITISASIYGCAFHI